MHPPSMKLNLYEKSKKYCNLTGKLFCVLKANTVLQLNPLDGVDEDLTFR